MSKTKISMVGVGSIIADTDYGTLSPEGIKVTKRLNLGPRCLNPKQSAKMLFEPLAKPRTRG
jgi:hypothetical protein